VTKTVGLLFKFTSFFWYRDTTRYRDTWDGIVLVLANPGTAQH